MQAELEVASRAAQQLTDVQHVATEVQLPTHAGDHAKCREAADTLFKQVCVPAQRMETSESQALPCAVQHVPPSQVCMLAVSIVQLEGVRPDNQAAVAAPGGAACDSAGSGDLSATL